MIMEFAYKAVACLWGSLVQFLPHLQQITVNFTIYLFYFGQNTTIHSILQSVLGPQNLNSFSFIAHSDLGQQ